MPRSRKEMAGLRVGDATVVAYAGQKKWLVRCDCGHRSTPTGAAIRNGKWTGACFGHPEGQRRRFDSKFLVDSSSGCWLWVACLHADGYGSFRVDDGTALAHVHSYEREHGPVPEGFELDHLCRNRACVNPAHLEPVTHAENVRRGNMRSIVKARGYAV